jgi:hypothetical protein|nr:MAG TPA: hypothetical protein [Caudoviricetes sp.]DAE80537.1 MAG TPA: hypothetical protein [Caudoviricetes sp.]
MFSPQYYANPAAYASPMGNPSTMQMQRLAQMEQQYPQFAQQPMGQNFTQQQAPIYMKCRAVTSIDEAKAAMIDLDGSLHVFTDIPHRKIYTKQINLDGTASLNIYSLEETPTPVQSGATVPNSAKESSVPESIFTQTINSLQSRISALEDKFEQRGDINVQSNANVQPRKRSKSNDASNANDV